MLQPDRMSLPATFGPGQEIGRRSALSASVVIDRLRDGPGAVNTPSRLAGDRDRVAVVCGLVAVPRIGEGQPVVPARSRECLFIGEPPEEEPAQRGHPFLSPLFFIADATDRDAWRHSDPFAWGDLVTA